MVRKYIRKLREKAAKDEKAAKLIRAGNKENKEQKVPLNEGQEVVSLMITDDVVKLVDDEPPDLQALDEDAESGTFVKFGDLPQELRLKIWTKALPAPRVLRIDGPDSLIRRMSIVQKDNDDGLSEVCKVPKYGLVFSTSDANISMLSACWESRHVAAKAYPIHLPSEDNSKEIRVGGDDVLVIGNMDRILKMVNEVAKLDPTALDKFMVLQGVQTLAFVAMTEDDEASMESVAEQLIVILTNRIVFMPLFLNVKSIKVICDRTNSTCDGSLEGFVTSEQGEYDEDRCDLLWRAKNEQYFYGSLRNVWKTQNNVSFPPMEIMITKEYI